MIASIARVIAAGIWPWRLSSSHCKSWRRQNAFADTKPQISIEKKYLEISVVVDNALKPFAGLFANCLAEGKTWADKANADATAQWRADPKSFRDLQWSYDRIYDLRSVVGRYVSIVRSDGTFEGGAHPNQEIDTILWDAVAQKRISIRPFFAETADNGPTMTALARSAQLAVAAAKLANGINGYGDDDTPASKLTPEQELRQDSFIKDGIKPKLLELGPVTLAPSTESGKSAGTDVSLFALRGRTLCRRSLHRIRAVDGLPAISVARRRGDLRRRAAQGRRGQMVTTPSPSGGSCRRRRSRRVALRLHPGLDLAFGFGLGEAVARLQAADQFAAAAADARDVLVGELGPIVADLALELHPIDLNLIPVHRLSP